MVLLRSSHMQRGAIETFCHSFSVWSIRRSKPMNYSLMLGIGLKGASKILSLDQIVVHVFYDQCVVPHTSEMQDSNQ